MIDRNRLILHTCDPLTCANTKSCRVCSFQSITVQARARAKITHGNRERKTLRGVCRVAGRFRVTAGHAWLCRVCRSIRARAHAWTVNLGILHTLHTFGVFPGQGHVGLRAPEPPALLDACPFCESGPAEISRPLSVIPGSNDSLRAGYRCAHGHAWVTWWDRRAAGWPERAA